MQIKLFKLAANGLMALANLSKLIPSHHIRNKIADRLESAYASLISWYQP
jgi:hypothetical protein